MDLGPEGRKYWLGKTGWKLDKGDIPSCAEVRHFPECPRVPYRLPELVRAVAEGKTIWIPEGEKDVDKLRPGLAATCNPGGASKWPADSGNTSAAPVPWRCPTMTSLAEAGLIVVGNLLPVAE